MNGMTDEQLAAARELANGRVEVSYDDLCRVLQLVLDSRDDLARRLAATRVVPGPMSHGRFRTIAREARAAAGAWVLTGEYGSEQSARTIMSRIRGGMVAGMVRDEFEPVLRGRSVWVRYVGGEDR